ASLDRLVMRCARAMISHETSGQAAQLAQVAHILRVIARLSADPNISLQSIAAAGQLSAGYVTRIVRRLCATLPALECGSATFFFPRLNENVIQRTRRPARSA